MEVVFLAVLIGTMAAALASGFPVAFALPGSAILSIGVAALCGYLFTGNPDAYFLHGGPQQWLTAGVTNFRGVYWEVERDTLIAIPLFVFMGIMLERSKVAEDLLVTMAQLFGPIPGGLGIAVVFVGALLAATTGIVGATVVAMGLISLPVMLRARYSPSLATGTISASGTLGQIIPPSIVLIILADQLASATDQAATLRQAEFKAATGQTALPSEYSLTSTSAGDMFLGALLPGMVLVGLYMLYILVASLLRPRLAPPVRSEGGFDRALLLRVLLALVPPLALIFIVLGSIIMGVATVNQAGAIGAVGAVVMAGYRLRSGSRGAFAPAVIAVGAVAALAVLLDVYDINIKNTRTASEWTGVALAALAVAALLVAVAWSLWRTHRVDGILRGVMVETARTTSLVFIILLGAAMLTAAFRAFSGEELVREFLSGLPGGFITKFVVVMAVIFVLGFFLDFIEIAVVVVPIIAPILLADTSANVTAVWLGVMIGVNMQTSFLTPPFGFALFYLRGVAPAAVKTVQMYAGVVPFILLQLTGLAIVGLWPALVNYLPARIQLTSDTAPPPKNPRLQPCIERMLFEEYDARAPEIRDAVARAGALDTSPLPQALRSGLDEGLEAAGAVFARVADVRAAEAALQAYIPGYERLHREVRGIERRIRDRAHEAERVEDRIRQRLRDGADASGLRAELAAVSAEVAALQATVPAEWEGRREAFLALSKAEARARRAYRRTVDDAYEPVARTLAMVDQTGALRSIGGRLRALRAVAGSAPPAEAAERLKGSLELFSGLDGVGHIRSRFSRARRALGRGTPDPARAAREIAEGLRRYDAELAWRARAAEGLRPALAAYEAAIRDTLGLRSQPRLTGGQAARVAGCMASHRDISLNF